MVLLMPFIDSRTDIRHNESTTRCSGTSPTIGDGTAKISRDYCIHGYGVGCTPNDSSKEAQLFDYNVDHALLYDLETEFVSRAGECNVLPPILCCSLVCTCR